LAHVDPSIKPKKENKRAEYRFDCAESRAEIDLDVNNVRARLQVGGDIFWNFDDGRYIVPKRDPDSGIEEVSSIFAASVWLGGVSPNETGGPPSLRLACQDYRTTSGVDFFPGPLTDEEGATDAATCANWDRFFRVRGDSIRVHLANIEFYRGLGVEYPESEIPLDLRRWPARGNPYFGNFFEFDLPDLEQGLGNFFDNNQNEIYEPLDGDYPVIDIRGCIEPQFPDDMYFFVYNDAGNTHEVTMSDPIRMEVQVQAFGYRTQDEVNDMTFYRYKLINRAPQVIDSTFFSMWIDPDLGCPDDDFIGCDSTESLMYVYNEDAVDGINGCDCTVGGQIIPTYCDEVPILGVDYFRGPLSEPRLQPDGTFAREDLGMTSFSYYNRGGGNNPPGTEEPETAEEFYNLLNGFWRDGTPYTIGGNGYQSGNVTTRYAFPFAPDDNNDWNMCNANVIEWDRRTLQTTGPFILTPGAVNELIIGVVWLQEANYPCPSIDPLLRADRTAQSLFDNCFEILDGPDAPTMFLLELDQEVVFTLTNSDGSSNNAGLNYEQKDPRLPKNSMVEDSTYKFEGYRIYQLASVDVTPTQDNLADITKAREILSYDLVNGVRTIYNWEGIIDPSVTDEEEILYVPVEKVEGIDNGITHSFSVTQDAFADGEDPRLINFRKYYYTVIAYGYNNHTPFTAENAISSQRTPYIVGRRNVQAYTVVPRKTAHLNLNTFYGEGLEVTLLDGKGVQNNILDISNVERERVVAENKVDRLTYLPGMSPLNAQVYDPINIQDGTYLLTLPDYSMNPSLDTTNFTVTQIEGANVGETYTSESTLDVLNEELIHNFGFSVQFAQGVGPGNPQIDASNGFLGSSISYLNPDGPQWYNFIPEGATPAVDFIKTNYLDADIRTRDPEQIYSNDVMTGFYPFILLAYDTIGVDGLNQTNGFFYSPGWFNSFAAQLRRDVDGLENLNNVDIVYTSNKDLWSRCMIVQSANYVYDDQISEDSESFDLLRRTSVTKEADPNDPNLPADDLSATGNDAVGYGYFPGYAVDVETGKRLNIFFGENTAFDPENTNALIANVPDTLLTGNDRMWNPSTFTQFDNLLAGNLHYTYVTNLEYDGCKQLHDTLLAVGDAPILTKRLRKRQILKFVSWAGFPIMAGGEELLSYDEGLIPNELTVSMRVKSEFEREVVSGSNDGYNQYEIKVEGKSASDIVAEEDVESALDLINVVPNPYYSYSIYETRATDNIVKITNLPQQCDITIYSLDGKFVRKYNRNAQGAVSPFNNSAIPERLFAADVEWDLKNDNGIPIASGIYFIHVEAPGLGERVIKWFGVNRKFDPSAIN